MVRLRLLLAFIGIVLWSGAGIAQNARVSSQCLAVAQKLPQVTFVSLPAAASSSGEVTITYGGHSTYVIETPEGETIATDYSGMYTAGKLPTIVTMNRAHTTHYTDRPDPRIKHVLRGWGEGSAPAQHAQTVGDVLIRNVTTDIRRGFGGFGGFGSIDSDGVAIKDGNSIFIFEVAGLCIGHLGHLHHPLTDEHYAEIGRLDILMVPIDGGLTMSLDRMSGITQRLRSSIVLPMHRFGTTIEEFVAGMKGQFETDVRGERSFSVSLRTLPKRPTVIILNGV
jgi:L-ascorbate metabolism protein UlaG (beta-lactamase superfamily)